MKVEGANDWRVKIIMFCLERFKQKKRGKEQGMGKGELIRTPFWLRKPSSCPHVISSENLADL